MLDAWSCSCVANCLDSRGEELQERVENRGRAERSSQEASNAREYCIEPSQESNTAE